MIKLTTPSFSFVLFLPGVFELLSGWAVLFGFSILLVLLGLAVLLTLTELFRLIELFRLTEILFSFVAVKERFKLTELLNLLSSGDIILSNVGALILLSLFLLPSELSISRKLELFLLALRALILLIESTFDWLWFSSISTVLLSSSIISSSATSLLKTCFIFSLVNFSTLASLAPKNKLYKESNISSVLVSFFASSKILFKNIWKYFILDSSCAFVNIKRWGKSGNLISGNFLVNNSKNSLTSK